jgi:hypothetical protein
MYRLKDTAQIEDKIRSEFKRCFAALSMEMNRRECNRKSQLNEPADLDNSQSKFNPFLLWD